MAVFFKDPETFFKKIFRDKIKGLQNKTIEKSLVCKILTKYLTDSQALNNMMRMPRLSVGTEV